MYASVNLRFSCILAATLVAFAGTAFPAESGYDPLAVAEQHSSTPVDLKVDDATIPWSAKSHAHQTKSRHQPTKRLNVRLRWPRSERRAS